MKKLSRLDIWDFELLNDYNLKDPRNILDKLLHSYLRNTKGISNMLVIRALDKVLKYI